MPEKMRALYRGKRDANGVPLERLGAEAPREPGGTPERSVPARHLTEADYDALSPRNKERVRSARSEDGGPLYEVRSVKDMDSASEANAKGKDE